MQHKPLQHALSTHFQLDKRRLDFIARFIIALLKVRTVNLNCLARHLGITPSGAWALEREHLEQCSRDTMAWWNEGVGLHVRPDETRKVLIQRLLEMKPGLLERGWCPPELGFDAPTAPVLVGPSQTEPLVHRAHQTANVPEAGELLDEERDWDEIEWWAAS
jgi:hypothetical protein